MAAACSCNCIFGVKNGTNLFAFCGMIRDEREEFMGGAIDLCID